MQRIDDDYLHYDRNGVSLLLPTSLKVRRHAPALYADAKRRNTTFLLQLDPEKGVQNAAESMLARPQGTIPELATTVVRERRLSAPYKGVERIIEHQVVDRPDVVNFGWVALFYPGQSFLLVTIGADGTFASNGALWQTVIDSIQVLQA